MIWKLQFWDCFNTSKLITAFHNCLYTSCTSKCCPISSPTCLGECLFTAIFFFLYKSILFQHPYFKVTAARGNAAVWILRLLWKCWNKEFDWKPSNSSALLRINFFNHFADSAFSSIYIRVGSLVNGMTSEWSAHQKWLFSLYHGIWEILRFEW